MFRYGLIQERIWRAGQRKEKRGYVRIFTSIIISYPITRVKQKRMMLLHGSLINYVYRLQCRLKARVATLGRYLENGTYHQIFHTNISRKGIKTDKVLPTCI